MERRNIKPEYNNKEQHTGKIMEGVCVLKGWMDVPRLW